MKKIVDMEAWNAFYAEQMQGREPYDHYDNGYEDAIDKVDNWLEEHPDFDVWEWFYDGKESETCPGGSGGNASGNFLKKRVNVFRTGEWFYDGKDLLCSECKNNALHDIMTGASVVSPFCPHCGAKMSDEVEPRSFGGNGGSSGAQVAADEKEKNWVWVYDDKGSETCPRGSGGSGGKSGDSPSSMSET